MNKETRIIHKDFTFNSEMPMIWPIIPNGAKVTVTYEWEE